MVKLNYYKKGGFFVKKLIFVLLCGVMLTGCANKKEEAKEYTVDEFSDIYWGISSYDSDQFSKLTREEQYGGYKLEKEMTEFANPIHSKF